MVVIKILEGVLQAGASSISFTDSDIPFSVTSSYCSKDGMYPIREEVSGSTITLYYQPQSTNTNVALKLVKGNLEIIDALTDTSTDKALSANQGKLLNDALQEVFTSVSNGKALIAGAITDKGVDTPADATFAIMAENIESISGGGGDLHLSDLELLGSVTSPANNTTNAYNFSAEVLQGCDEILFVSGINGGPNATNMQSRNEVVSVSGGTVKVLVQGAYYGSRPFSAGVVSGITGGITINIWHNMSNVYVTNTVFVYGIKGGD